MWLSLCVYYFTANGSVLSVSPEFRFRSLNDLVDPLNSLLYIPVAFALSSASLRLFTLFSQAVCMTSRRGNGIGIDT